MFNPWAGPASRRAKSAACARNEPDNASQLLLDMLRDLKRINAHLVAVVHTILDAEGLLVESLLRALAAQGK